jgi:predicted enzyme related to lactoylglutathione lyase
MSKHPIVHIELSSKDRKGDAKFYHDLFGWEIQDFPDVNYSTFVTGEGEPGGGFNPIMDGNPPGTVMVYINTDDIKETLRKVESLGGKVISPPQEIPSVGDFAVFSDLTGNKVALLQPLPRQ